MSLAKELRDKMKDALVAAAWREDSSLMNAIHNAAERGIHNLEWSGEIRDHRTIEYLEGQDLTVHYNKYTRIYTISWK